MGDLILSLFCYALFCVHSSFAIILNRKRKTCPFTIIILQMYCYYKCSVELPHGAMGWSAVCWSAVCVFPDHTLCDCGIS